MTARLASLQGATLSLLAALATTALPGVAHATTHQIKSHQHQTERNGVAISIYEKWANGEEKNFKKTGKVILLVHGATWSSHCTFDPAPNYSLMDTLADAGWDVFAIDLHGYGKSGKSDQDWTDAKSAADDIDAAIDYIRALRWVERVSLFGYQWGAQPTGLFAVGHPNKVGRVALFGMRYRITEKRAAPREVTRQNSAQSAMLKPDDGDLDPEFVRHRAQVCAAEDPESPNGALIDLTRVSPVDPRRLEAPTLLIMGDGDADPTVLADRLEFYRGLAANDRWFVVVPGLGKYATIEKGRARFEQALIDFLE